MYFLSSNWRRCCSKNKRSFGKDLYKFSTAMSFVLLNILPSHFAKLLLILGPQFNCALFKVHFFSLIEKFGKSRKALLDASTYWLINNNNWLQIFLDWRKIATTLDYWILLLRFVNELLFGNVTSRVLAPLHTPKCDSSLINRSV
jgi:hypothetical protein